MSCGLHFQSCLVREYPDTDMPKPSENSHFMYLRSKAVWDWITISAGMLADARMTLRKSSTRPGESELAISPMSQIIGRWALGCAGGGVRGRWRGSDQL